jgi:single-strand DNA-binding protein
MNEIHTTVVGNLTADPELRYTPTGDAVANFTVASTPRVYDRASGEWRDGDPVFLRCSLWRQPAENMVASLRRGDRVVVTGRLRQRSWETDAGDKRYSLELDTSEVGASVAFRQVRPMRVERTRAATADDTATAAADEPPS